MIAGSLTYDTHLDTKGFQKGINDITNKAKTGGSKVKDIVSALGITKLISAGFNVITSSIDGAITRLDTLNNFPRVMSNLGIGAEEAEKSIKKMSDKLAGLPTTLDEGAMAVQRFTSKNGDVEKSTDIFLALNNALLAGGASAEIQSSALEQISQAYAKGKPDMIEWRSLLTAMPAQVSQLAKAFNMTSDELGEALRNGTISMDDFMEKVIELNETGIDGFQSFEEQAKNSTGGIQTAITVAKTQVVKGMADIINSIDTAIKDKGLGGIGEIISNIGKKAKEAMDLVAEKIPDIINFLIQVYDKLVEFSPVLITIVASVVAYNTAMKVMVTLNIASQVLGTVSAFIALLPAITSVTDAMTLLNIAFGLNPIALVVAGIVALIAVLVLLWNNCEGFRNFWISLWDTIRPTLIEFKDAVVALFEAFQPLFNFIKDQFIKVIEEAKGRLDILITVTTTLRKLLIQAVTSLLTTFFKFETTMVKVLTTVINWFNKLATQPKQALNDLKNAVISILGSLPNKMLEIGKNIIQGLWNGISDKAQWLRQQLQSLGGNIVNWAKKVLKIGSPSKVFRDEVGKWIPEGIAVGIKADTDSALKALDVMNDEMVDRMNKAVNFEVGKAGTSGITGSVSEILNTNSKIIVENNNTLELDGEKIYENQQTIQKNKNLQYAFGGV